jgi:ketosteroid isomerase-like protein
MSAADNKRLMQEIFAEVANGNGTPFVDAMADDIRWTVTGTTPWSRTFEGKAAVLNDMFRPVLAQFAGQYAYSVSRFVAEDDIVVVEFKGRNTTNSGKPYNNAYCHLCRLEGGKLKEVVEYLDTQLLAEALQPPAAQEK